LRKYTTLQTQQTPLALSRYLLALQRSQFLLAEAGDLEAIQINKTTAAERAAAELRTYQGIKFPFLAAKRLTMLSGEQGQ